MDEFCELIVLELTGVVRHMCRSSRMICGVSSILSDDGLASVDRLPTVV